MEMVLATLHEDRTLVLEIIGTLGLAGASELKTQFTLLAERGLRSVDVNLARTDVVTSVGISALAHVWESSSRQGLPIRFHNVSKSIQRLFEIVGVKEMFLDEQKTP
jgi:anti-anti-sigma factor